MVGRAVWIGLFVGVVAVACNDTGDRATGGRSSAAAGTEAATAGTNVASGDGDHGGDTETAAGYGGTAHGETGGETSSGGTSSGGTSSGEAGGETSIDGGAGGAAGSASVSPETQAINDFIQQYEAAYCERAFTCCTEEEAPDRIATCALNPGGLFPDTAEQLVKGVEAGRLVLDKDGAQACVDALKAMSCQEYADATLFPTQCAKFAKGKVEVRHFCTGSFECISGSCEIENDEYDGFCGEPIGPGQPCYHGNCQNGYFCAVLDNNAGLACTALVADGEACHYDEQCAGGHCAGDHCAPLHKTQCDGDGVGRPLPACTGDVTFADPGLEAAVRRELGLPSGPISGERAAALRQLSASQHDIVSLSGAECLVNISTLELFANSISDLTPLAKLANLKTLDLSRNQIADATPLAKLTSLTFLDLSVNQVTDLTPLARLTNMKRLALAANGISDIAVLSSMTGLDDLDIGYNQLTDITPLTGLTALDVLSLNVNQVTDLTPLAGMKGLVRLGLAFNEISDIGVVASMTRLSELDVGHNHVTDLTPVAGLDLYRLTLDSNPITDLSPLVAIRCPMRQPAPIVVMFGLPGEPFCNDPNVAALKACGVSLVYTSSC